MRAGRLSLNARALVARSAHEGCHQRLPTIIWSVLKRFELKNRLSMIVMLCLLYLPGARATQEGASFSLRIHLADWREARRLMLEDILTVQESGVFNEMLWACDGTVWDTVGCSALRNAIFCLSNYYLIDRLNVARGFSKANWISRDGGQEGLLELSSWCQAEVPVWQSGSTANCKDAMSHLSLKFPSTQCRRALVQQCNSHRTQNYLDKPQSCPEVCIVQMQKIVTTCSNQSMRCPLRVSARRRLHRVVNLSSPGNALQGLILVMGVMVSLLTSML
ncbi:hypothetical protein Esti_005205 [Eimeria stiedai]